MYTLCERLNFKMILLYIIASNMIHPSFVNSYYLVYFMQVPGSFTFAKD